MHKDLSRGLLLLMLCGAAAFAQQSVPVSPIQAPDVTLQGPQRQQPPGQRQPASGIPAAAPRPQTALRAPFPGTIEGFVYWDAGTISHNPTGSCSGLNVTVSVGSPSSGPGPTLEQFTPLPPLTNNFKYVGNIGTYAVCTYAFDHVPVGQDIQVKVDVTGATVFSPISAPAVGTTGPIKIVNGKCNNLPPAVPSTSDLTSHWWTCGNYAYDVNFVLQPSAHIMSATTGTGTLLVAPSKPAGMLSGAPQGGMLATNPTAQAQPAAVMPATGGSPAPPAAGSGQVLGKPTVSSQKSLTNTDVIKMVQAGVPEPAIISSLQSNGKNFDFSPAGCQSLNTANVSANVLTAMGDGSVRPCTAATGTGGATAAVPGTATPSIKPPLTREQQLAILKKPSPGSRVPLLPNKVAPPKALRKVRNPRLAEQTASIIAVLQQQKFAADREASAMKVGTRVTTSEASAPRLALSANLGSNSVQNLAPEKTQDFETLSSRMAHEPYFNGIVLACAKDPTPRIAYVNGGEGHGTIFTPDPKYNFYTIVGCGFGPSSSGNMAYITGSGFKANLNIDSWGDNGITAHLDPWLAGVLDQDNVNLVVVSPAAGSAIQQSGFQFYAARGMLGDPNNTPQEVPLAYNSVPQSAVKISSITPDVLFGWDSLPQNATSAYPGFSYQGTPVVGWVFRYAYGHDDSGEFFNTFDPTKTVGNYECWINGQEGFEFVDQQGNQIIAQEHDCSPYFSRSNMWTDNLWGPFAADQWNIPLQPQFAVSSYNLYYDPTDPSQICGAWDDSSKQSGQIGNWDFNLTASNQISVSYQLNWCFDQEAWPFNRVNAQRMSTYGMAVWVWGPRCIDPINGKPDTACMATVKQRLGG